MNAPPRFKDSAEAFWWLERFFLGHCDGDWEQEYGCKIETQSEPGWYFEFDLVGTALENEQLPLLEDHDGALRNITIRVENKKFIGSCGPKQMHELLTLFRDFIEGRLPRPGVGMPIDEQ